MRTSSGLTHANIPLQQMGVMIKDAELLHFLLFQARTAVPGHGQLPKLRSFRNYSSLVAKNIACRLGSFSQGLQHVHEEVFFPGAKLFVACSCSQHLHSFTCKITTNYYFRDNFGLWIPPLSLSIYIFIFMFMFIYLFTYMLAWYSGNRDIQKYKSVELVEFRWTEFCNSLLDLEREIWKQGMPQFSLPVSHRRACQCFG